MPMYEYACLKCKNRFELLRPYQERDDRAECPECGTEKKHIRVPSLFSGGGKDASSGGCAPLSSGGG